MKTGAKEAPDTGVELKGLSRYLVRDEGGELRVWGKRYGKWKMHSRVFATQGRFFLLKGDDGRSAHYPEGALRFLLANRGVSALAVRPTRGELRFNPDGTPMGAVVHKRAFTVFGSIDDALATVLLMKRAAARPEEAIPLKLAQEWRKQAMHTARGLLRCPYAWVEDSWDNAVEMFARKMEECNLERIMPLYALLCMCLRVAVKERGKSHGGPVTDREMFRLRQ